MFRLLPSVRGHVLGAALPNSYAKQLGEGLKFMIFFHTCLAVTVGV